MKLFNISHAVAAAAFLAVIPETSLADEAVLYAEGPPQDAVFVRVLGDAPSVPFGGMTLSAPADTYVAISAADLHGVAAGGHYSLIPQADGSAMMIAEPDRDTAAKVHLFVVNADDAPVRLTAPEHGMEVLAGVETQTAQSRAVNPITVTLAVERISDGAVLGTFDLALARGQNVSFVVQDGAARMIQNLFGPVIKR